MSNETELYGCGWSPRFGVLFQTKGCAPINDPTPILTFDNPPGFAYIERPRSSL